MRESIFAAALLVAGLSFIVGVSMYSVEAAWMTGGVLFGAWAWLVLSDAP